MADTEQPPQQPPQVGTWYKRKDGRVMRYLGGNPTDERSWTAREYYKKYNPAADGGMDPAMEGAGTPSQLESSDRVAHQALLNAAAAAIPVPGGPLARIAGNTAIGAGLGAVTSPKGERVRGGLIGGLAFGIGSGMMEGGTAAINALQAPGSLLSMAGDVPALRDQLAGQATRLGAYLKEKEQQVASTFSERAAIQKGLENEAVQKVTDRAARDVANQNAMAGPAAATKVREISGIEPPLWVSRGLTKEELAKTQTELYQPLAEQHKVVSDPDLLKFVQSKPMEGYTAKVLGQEVAEGTAPMSFAQSQDLRNYLRKNDPILAKQMTPRMNAAFGEDLVVADQKWADLNERLRGHKGVSIAMPSDKIIEATVGKGVSTPRAEGVREAWVADFTRKLGEKDSGAPTLEKVLGGGPEWEARLSAIFPNPDDLNNVRAILQDAKERVAQINSARDVAVGDLRTKGLFENVRMDAEKQKTLLGLAEEYGKPLEKLGLLDKQLMSAEQKRAQLQKIAETTAKRILTTVKWAVIGGGLMGTYRKLSQKGGESDPMEIYQSQVTP